MLALIKTCFQICLLRKGPEVIPVSPIMFGYAVVVWIGAVLFTVATIPTFTAGDVRISATSSAFALGLYYFTLMLRRKTHRAWPTLTAMLCCGSLISVGVVLALLALTPIDRSFALITAQLVLFWSVPVKGHILARALGVHWYIGIVVAIVVFAIQFSFSISMTPEQ